jgi:hypothetical protein
MVTCQAICLKDKKLYYITIHVLNIGESKPMPGKKVSRDTRIFFGGEMRRQGRHSFSSMIRQLFSSAKAVLE